MELKELQRSLGVSNDTVYGMIRTLIRAGYGKPEFLFLSQSNQAYSLVFDDIQATLINAGEIKFEGNLVDLG